MPSTVQRLEMQHRQRHTAAFCLLILTVGCVVPVAVNAKAQGSNQGISLGCFPRAKVSLHTLRAPTPDMTATDCPISCLLKEQMPLSAWVGKACYCGCEIPALDAMLDDKDCKTGVAVAGKTAAAKEEAIELRYMHLVPGQTCTLSPLSFQSKLWNAMLPGPDTGFPDGTATNLTQSPTAQSPLALINSTDSWTFGMQSVILTPATARGIASRFYVVAPSRDKAANFDVAIGFTIVGNKSHAGDMAHDEIHYKAWVVSDRSGRGNASNSKAQTEGVVNGTSTSANSSSAASTSATSTEKRTTIKPTAMTGAAAGDPAPSSTTEPIVLSFTWQPTYVIFYINGQPIYNVTMLVAGIPSLASQTTLSTSRTPVAACNSTEGCPDYTKLYESIFSDVRRVVCGAPGMISQLRDVQAGTATTPDATNTTQPSPADTVKGSGASSSTSPPDDGVIRRTPPSPSVNSTMGSTDSDSANSDAAAATGQNTTADVTISQKAASGAGTAVSRGLAILSAGLLALLNMLL